MLPRVQHDKASQDVSAMPAEATNAGALRHSEFNDESNPHRQRGISTDGGHELKPPVISLKDGNAILFMYLLARKLRIRASSDDPKLQKQPRCGNMPNDCL